jgi:pescadillo protein
MPEEESSTSNKQEKQIAKEAKEEKEQKELAKIMMTKKDKYLYHRIQHGKQKKAEKVEALKKKKAQLSGGQKKKN